MQRNMQKKFLMLNMDLFSHVSKNNSVISLERACVCVFMCKSVCLLPFSCNPMTPLWQNSIKEFFSALGKHKYWLFPYLSFTQPNLFDALSTSGILEGHSLRYSITCNNMREKHHLIVFEHAVTSMIQITMINDIEISLHTL